MKRRGLKPCPWCGCIIPTLVEHQLWTENWVNGRIITHGYVGEYEYYYQCSNKECGAIAPHGKYDSIAYSTDKARILAKKAWQKRDGEDEENL